MMFRQLKVGERLQPFTGTTGQGQAAMLVIAVVDMVYLVYSYRGHEYTVYENLAQGNEPLAWQHRNEQSQIDQLIEQEEQEKNTQPKPCRYEDTAQYALDQLYNFLDGEPSDFD
ncbi:hypothetical protein [Bifidobacterium catenulatum]|uniref:hypothetical protein n=2 Tax=Bifidobacterium catenulatum TaxID=1686 RepID=UPI0034A0F366